MNTRRYTSSRLATEPLAFALFKYWQALLAFGVATAVGATPVPRLMFTLPLVLWGVFCLTTVQVRAGREALEYRRFLKWRRVPYTVLRACKRSLLPALGYVRFGAFIPPWGKLYFVIARPAFGGGPDQIVPYISARISGAEPPVHVESQTPDKRGRNVRSWAAALAVGVLCSLMVYYLSPGALTTPSLAGYPAAARVAMRVWESATTWPWGIVTLAALGVLSFCDRSAKRGWVLAAAIGFTLAGMVLAAIG
jgi:hypothetical protein